MSSNSTGHGPPPDFLLDPTKRPPPPAGLDLDETRQPQVIAVAVILWLVAVLSVVLRIVSRRIKNARLWLDDWIIIASVVSSSECRALVVMLNTCVAFFHRAGL